MTRFAILMTAVVLGSAAVPCGAVAQQPPRGKRIAPAPAARPDTTRQTKRLLPPPAPQRQSAPTAPAAAPQQAGNAAANPNAIVTPQAQAAPAPPVAAFTAGLSVPVFAGSAAAALDYGRTFGQMLDSTVVTLVGVFRNTSGQPIAGATGPDVLSGREKDRWTRCRNIFWDLTSYKTGLEAALPSYAASPALAHAARELDTALTAALDDSAATPECDNISSMITAPGRWTPWQDQYETHARHFYGAWYDQILNVHDKDRAFVVELNQVVPAARRLPVPPALQRNPPYAGAAVR